jgi:hypothetical protein
MRPPVKDGRMNLDTDSALSSNSDAVIASQKAVKTYVDTRLAGIVTAVGDIGTPGAAGFGVGICPLASLPTGFTLLAGFSTPSHANYGNYAYSDGSTMVFIPAFYYKVGTGSNGLGVNAIDVRPKSYYANTPAANADGYALHRAFIDGGVEQVGFFVDKYKVSKVAKGAGYVGGSIKNGLPLSTSADHNPIVDLTASGGVNAYYKAIDCAHARDGVAGAVNAASIFHVASQFQRAALALLSMAHGQACTSTVNCAWYNATYNYPKGCNNNALRDADDTSVLYVTDGYSNCGKTGSGDPFAKTTHNGQACGVSDLNGLMYEISLGVTCNGTNFYAAKQATAMKAFTSGNAGATDHWGATGIAAMMDQFTPPFPGNDAWTFFGNGANQVLSEAVSGAGYLLAGLGLPKDVNGFDATGTVLFGKDGCYQAVTNELCLLACANWYGTSIAGVWSLAWNGSRSHSDNYLGWRCACYPV